MAAPTRENLLALLEKSLEPLPYIHAAWLEGADALGTVDAYSDIDLWLDVEDGHVDEAVDAVRKSLETLSPLELDYERDQPHPKIRQCFLRIQGTSKFSFVDLCVQSHSRAFAFTESQDAVKVLFDKKEVVKFQPPQELDTAALVRTLSTEFDIFQTWVEKALAREQLLEAVEAYYNYTLSPLIKLLRLRYAPLKLDYGVKHSYRELPSEVTVRLESLHKVTSIEELRTLHARAKAWFHEERLTFS